MTETNAETKDGLAAALARVQGDMPSVHKGKTATVPTKSGGSYKYSYADLADVAAAIMPLLAANGLAFIASPRHVGDGNYELQGQLLHTSGESAEGALPLFGRDMQSLGSSLSYGRRYLLGCLTGVVTDDDDDGAGATDKRTARRQPAPRQAAQQQAPPPPPPEDPWAEPQSGGTPAGITEPQQRNIGRLMKKLDITVRDEALGYVAGIIGHPIASRTELTKAQASAVIEKLKVDAGETDEQAAS